MSIYRDTNASVSLTHPYPGPLVATVYRDGQLILTSSPISPVAGVYTLGLTYAETQYDGPLNIVWTDSTQTPAFVRTTTEQVVTPLVPVSKLRTIFEDTNKTDQELMDLESSVRIFIQAYTHQTFGYEVGTITIMGTGEQRMALPRHMISITDVNTVDPGYFWLSDDGWYINSESKNLLTVKEAPPEEYMDNTIAMTHGVIVVPDTYWRKFRTGVEYDITGEWGYYTVPDNVQEATMLLANDFACDESLYRDRFVQMVNTGSSSFSFDSRAFVNTGNARADELLKEYRRDGMVII